jgi:hypothetical protein
MKYNCNKNVLAYLLLTLIGSDCPQHCDVIVAGTVMT